MLGATPHEFESRILRLIEGPDRNCGPGLRRSDRPPAVHLRPSRPVRSTAAVPGARLSASGFYRWISAAAARAARRAADNDLGSRIEGIHDESNGAYGVPRITLELPERHGAVNHKRVARLMRERGLAGRHLRRTVRTAVADRSVPPAPDLFGRVFAASAPDVHWCGDITYLPVGGSWAGRSRSTCGTARSPTPCSQRSPPAAGTCAEWSFTPTTACFRTPPPPPRPKEPKDWWRNATERRPWRDGSEVEHPAVRLCDALLS
ncbi:IS3 family transposase [Kitasatospora hibisci]|uniref:IS3 family transposase n=1 Tax=Kitasatospora hibisci TaxID=3369522 RepID=UPI003754A394